MTSHQDKSYNIADVSINIQPSGSMGGITLSYSSGDNYVRDLIVEAISQRLRANHVIFKASNKLNNATSAADSLILSTTISNEATLFIDPMMGNAGMKFVTPQMVTEILDDLQTNYNSKDKLSNHVEALVAEAEDRLRTRRPHPDDASHAARERIRQANGVKPYLDAVINTLNESGITVDEETRKKLEAALIIARENKRSGGSGFTQF
ncbi:MAG: hypothetical protein SFW63_04065 [Alphaproteobacteria bacterium]|nr:hypothetical protein [Alphaproteobacteria bacterium]